VRGVSFQVEGRPFPKSPWVPQSNHALKGAMEQRASSWQALWFPRAIDPEWLDRARLDKDGQRIELWMAQHGYFDAKFLRWEVKRHGSDARKMHPVSIRGYLEQGEPSRIREVDIAGIGALGRSLQRHLRTGTLVVPGRVFSSTAYLATLNAVRSTLLAGGYAFVDVTGSVEAYPDEHVVDVKINVDLGPPSVFGPVAITGVTEMPDRIVAAAVTFKEGDPFTPLALAETRASLFGLRAFSVVNVTPSLEDREHGVVPVAIAVKNSRWRRLKLGPGLEVESGKGTAYGFVEWEHTNLFKRLWTFRPALKVGVAGVVAQDTRLAAFALSQVTVAPVLDVTAAVGIPHVAGPAWSFELDSRVQVGIETSYRFFSPEIAPGLTWRPMTHLGRDALSLALGYRLRYFDYFAFTSDVRDITDSPLGLDLTDPYLLSMLDQHLVFDGRDDPMAPTKGWYGSLQLGEAGGPVLGNFNFVRGQAELRGYKSMPRLASVDPRLVIAARVGGGIIVPYGTGPKASVPFAERLYLGGGTTVRGWGANRLGPSVATTDTTEPSASAHATVLVPAGGLFDALGNLELRKYVVAGVSVAAFTDVGRVWPSISDVTLEGLQWSVGGGLRYATVIGPIRGDVGVRLGEDPEFVDQPRWTVHFGLAEAF